MEVKLESDLEGIDFKIPTKRGEPVEKTGKHRFSGHGRRICDVRTNPARGRGEFRTLNGAGHHIRPFIGSRDTGVKRERGIEDWDAKNRLQNLREGDLETEDRKLDLNELTAQKPEYFENQGYDPILDEEKETDKSYSDRIKEMERARNIREALENERHRPLSRTERRTEEEIRKIDNFGKDKRPYRKGSHVTKILR